LILYANERNYYNNGATCTKSIGKKTRSSKNYGVFLLPGKIPNLKGSKKFLLVKITKRILKK